jgi:F-type H+-transporting ATPase subunit delta
MAKTSPFITQLARSLATHAADEGVLAKVVQDCIDISAALEENSDVRQALCRVSVPESKRIEMFNDALHSTAHKFSVNAFLLLIERGELQHASRFVDFLRRAASRVGLSELRITSAFHLSETEKNKLTRAVGLDPKNVTMTESVSPSLIGGFMMDIGDIRHDASILGKMKRLERALQA